ncbi:MAG TPA: transketolase C-terminal domain-containing protein, partial [Anseongella sp.]|nr:transketolase C-terminal domain-containing protein [Anseongella sp.]
ANWRKPMQKIGIGKGRKVSGGEEVAILSIGHPGNFVAEAIGKLAPEGITPAHYDMRFVKPLDEALLHEVFSSFKKIITVEDGCIMGGMGSAVLEFMAGQGYQARVVRLGIPDRVVEHGEQEELYAECQYDADAIARVARDLFIQSPSSNLIVS